ADLVCDPVLILALHVLQRSDIILPRFPYTMLFRSLLRVRSPGDGPREAHPKDGSPSSRRQASRRGSGPGSHWLRRILRFREEGRSEEHTSELQSRENLVCRLLLVKNQ